MKIHYLQHVPFEGLVYIESWLRKNKVAVSGTRFFKKADLPKTEEVDGLIVLGGPMSVNDIAAYPWLEQETRFIAEMIALGKPVLGICLGAQLIAKAAGAEVYKNPESEIGWFPISWFHASMQGLPELTLPEWMQVFQWHGETFDLPDGAIHLATGRACANQAFLLKERVLGLQFHLEVTPEGVEALIAQCGSDLKSGGRYVQTQCEILRGYLDFHHLHTHMGKILDALFAQGKT